MILPRDIVFWDLFSGTGGFARGLLLAGFIFKSHLFSEVDKSSIANYQFNFPKAANLGDLRYAKTKTIPRPDLVAFGSPCQDISLAGEQKGLHGKRSRLFFEAIRIIRQTKPRVFLFENVKAILSSNKGKDFEVLLKTIAELGIYECQWQVLNTAWFLPQHRERFYLVGVLREEGRPSVFPFTGGHPIPEAGFKARPSNHFVSSAITVTYSKGVHARGETYIQVPASKAAGKSRMRRLTPVECERLQGFPDGWTAKGVFEGKIVPISDVQRYRMLGNAVSVAVVAEIGRRLIKPNHQKKNIMRGKKDLSLGDVSEINIPEIQLHYERGNKPFYGKIIHSQQAADILRSLYPKGELELREHFIMLLLNRANKVLGYYRASKGGITGTVVDIRLLMAVALKSGAVGLILSHNHPSGETVASDLDIELTKKIKEAVSLYDIKLLDHIIVTKDSHYSFGDAGQLEGIRPTADILPDEQFSFVATIKDHLERGVAGNKKAVEKLAASFGINNKTTVKELTELAIVESARQISLATDLDQVEKYRRIVRLYESQVNLSHRTSESIMLQQYSTPAPIGYLAGIFCGVDRFHLKGLTAFEPSAGNGLLTISGQPSVFRVNEIGKLRNLNLQTQGFISVDKTDATEDFSQTLGYENTFDAVITNPPFGRSRVAVDFDGYKIDTLEHLMAIRALDTMKPKGKAAIIIGGHTEYDEKGRVRAGSQRLFLNYLYSHYYVADIIPIDGHKLYSRQGTSFDVRLILIDGRKPRVEGAAPVLNEGRGTVYLYNDKEFSEQDLIDEADAASTYDQWDAEAGPITTIEQALEFLGDEVKVKQSRRIKEKPVSRFDELYDRVTEAMKYSHQLTYKPDAEPPVQKKPENESMESLFKDYLSIKAKHLDAIILVKEKEGENFFAFMDDAKKASEVLDLELQEFYKSGKPVFYIKFPEERVEIITNRLMRHGHRVGLAEQLADPKKAGSKQSEADEAKYLQEKMREEIRRMESGEELGAPYLPASESCVYLHTVVPDSMDYETREALERIRHEVGGSIDEFVRQRLGYASKLDLCKALSAEQTDAVAMAIYNIEAREQGMIIGDQTGIGKGRIAASIIRYAIQRGLKPIFITEKPNLFSDIYRDLIAIGSAHLVPFIVNGRENKTDVKDENGEVLHQALPYAEQQGYFRDRAIPAKCDFVMATYTQFNSPDRKPEKPQFLLAVSENNILIMDESHNASGSSQTGEFLQEVVHRSLGVVFLSATFAKRPDNMPIYAMKTAISDANMNKEDLIAAIGKGGMALQEVLASQLVKEGQMLRRERSFEGIEVNYMSLDDRETEHKAIADNITEVLREIIAFQSGNVDTMIEEMDKIAVAEGKEVTQRGGTNQAGVDNLPYFSKVFQVINQMLFAIKAEAVADWTIERLKQGKKPVIAFSSTMGSFIEQMENDHGLPVGDGDVINADFSEVLLRGLDGVLRYTETAVNGDKVFKKLELNDLVPAVKAEYLRIAEKIKAMSSGICISPIDLILQKITQAGYKVAEVTGRKYEVQLNLKTGKGLVTSRNKVNTNDAFRQFNNNEIDVLMINQSGSTGASAHAIVTKKVPASEVKQRVMIVLQAELNINTEVQKRGRINRTGQILLPIYDYMISAIPAEKRLMMMLQNKLKSLDANTTSNQKQSTKILDVSDFLNKYGDKLVTQYLADNPEINKLLGDPLHLADTENEDAETTEDAAHKVSGRVAVLSTKMQADFYNEISAAYNDYVEYLKQVNEYDLEVETMNLEAETVSTQVVKMGKGGDSEFGADSVLEKVKANVLKKPFKRTELENILKEELGERNAKDLQKEMVDDFEKFVTEQMQADINTSNAHFDEEIKNISNERKAQAAKARSESEFLRYIAGREKELQEAKSRQEDKLRTQTQNRLNNLGSILEFFYTGRNLLYPLASFSEGDVNIKAVFIGFIVDKRKKNPYAPSNIRLRFALASSNKYIAMPASYSKDINAIIGVSHAVKTRDLETTLSEWEQAIKASDVSRNLRYVVTGNLLQAFSDYKGKLVSYTTNRGGVKKGILMPEYWEPKGEMQETVSVPVLRASKIIGSATKGKGITTVNGTTILNTGSDYKIIVPASRQRGGDVYLDSEILKLVEGNIFEKTADKMVAQLPHSALESFLQILQEKFNDSVELMYREFDLIKNEAHQTRTRNQIKLLTPQEVEEEENLTLMAMSLKVKMEMELELLRLEQAA